MAFAPDLIDVIAFVDLAAGIVGEAMVMLTLARFLLEKTGGDSMAEVRNSMERWRERLATPLRPAEPTAAAADGGTAGSGGDD